MWREGILTGRNRRAKLYRYAQMGVLAFMVSTLFLRDQVATTASVRVRFRLPHHTSLCFPFVSILNGCPGMLR